MGPDWYSFARSAPRPGVRASGWARPAKGPGKGASARPGVGPGNLRLVGLTAAPAAAAAAAAAAAITALVRRILGPWRVGRMGGGGGGFWPSKRRPAHIFVSRVTKDDGPPWLGRLGRTGLWPGSPIAGDERPSIVRVCALLRACLRACVRACVCMHACVCVRVRVRACACVRAR
jgi:hypothetical protein